MRSLTSQRPTRRTSSRILKMRGRTWWVTPVDPEQDHGPHRFAGRTEQQRTASAANRFGPFCARSTRTTFRDGRLSARPYRTGRSSRSLSLANLNATRTRWNTFPRVTGPHRQATLAEVVEAQRACGLVVVPRAAGQLPRIDQRLLGVQEPVREVLQRQHGGVRGFRPEWSASFSAPYFLSAPSGSPRGPE